MSEIARLTDRQIHELVSHRRNSDGQIVPELPSEPERPLNKEEARLVLLDLGATFNVPREKLQEAWEKKYPGETL